jgi:murein L,D-transpeptidase YcbB/YkuD
MAPLGYGLMRRSIIGAILWVLTTAAAQPPHWQTDQAAQLIGWLDRAPLEGLASFEEERLLIEQAVLRKDAAEIDRLSTASAVRLLEAFRSGCCRDSAGRGWDIVADQNDPPAEVAVIGALANDDLQGLFERALPSHPYYKALRRSLREEQDQSRRTTLALNMDRWRWMPRSLGPRYLLVNSAAFEATLWEQGQEVGRWKVVVGKMRSPTPVFSTQVTGIIFNPWWEIPSSIVAESVGALVRNRPIEAAKKGYVVQNGRYRQKPGPANALGRLKLVMPNSYSVYLHDTPAQKSFGEDVRTFSHGCVRVGDALDLATALLSNVPTWDRKRIDSIVAGRQTTTVPLSAPIPVYITYFTAEPEATGSIRYFPDVYKRDRQSPQVVQAEACLS